LRPAGGASPKRKPQTKTNQQAPSRQDDIVGFPQAGAAEEVIDDPR